uniref:RING-type domain-containing protein n=1 Tax=Xiphophorus maculatus TaxID=8083 RepID=A0A3B5QN06_XIPMA
MASLDEELTCSVCRDSFSQAHPLPCGHSFCPACIREAWSAQGEGKGRFTCPQCQEEHGEWPLFESGQSGKWVMREEEDIQQRSTGTVKATSHALPLPAMG